MADLKGLLEDVERSHVKRGITTRDELVKVKQDIFDQMFQQFSHLPFASKILQPAHDAIAKRTDEILNS